MSEFHSNKDVLIKDYSKNLNSHTPYKLWGYTFIIHSRMVEDKTIKGILGVYVNGR